MKVKKLIVEYKRGQGMHSMHIMHFIHDQEDIPNLCMSNIVEPEAVE